MRGLLVQPGLGAMPRQPLRLILGKLRELAFQRFGDTGMQRPSRLT